jgi:hypothetical protein
MMRPPARRRRVDGEVLEVMIAPVLIGQRADRATELTHRHDQSFIQ